MKNPTELSSRQLGVNLLIQLIFWRGLVKSENRKLAIKWGLMRVLITFPDRTALGLLNFKFSRQFLLLEIRVGLWDQTFLQNLKEVGPNLYILRYPAVLIRSIFVRQNVSNETEGPHPNPHTQKRAKFPQTPFPSGNNNGILSKKAPCREKIERF